MLGKNSSAFPYSNLFLKSRDFSAQWALAGKASIFCLSDAEETTTETKSTINSDGTETIETIITETTRRQVILINDLLLLGSYTRFESETRPPTG